jgi:aryl-alcohol dehydrogenase-like predicted oxidoreductase
MEYRLLGNSGLRIPALSFGTATFGGTNEFFQKWGETDVKEATRLVDLCLEREVNFFDTANVYSGGASEEILGKALKGKRSQALISTKATFQMGDGPNDSGSSRYHLIREVEASLKRLGTDYIDVYFMHWFDGNTPLEETLSTLDNLISSGKVRYIGCSNFSGWQVMKALATSEKNGLARYVIYQGYYSLIGREYEWELMPLALDQKLGLMVWSPLGWGRLTGKLRKGQPLPEGRIKSGGSQGGPEVSDEYLYTVIGALEDVASETGKTIPQVAINGCCSGLRFQTSLSGQDTNNSSLKT